MIKHFDNTVLSASLDCLFPVLVCLFVFKSVFVFEELSFVYYFETFNYPKATFGSLSRGQHHLCYINYSPLLREVQQIPCG